MITIDGQLCKAALFDLDGVIVDTAKYHFLAWKVIADGLGITFTEEDNERLKGVSRAESLKILLSLGNVSVPDDIFAKLLDKKNGIYREYLSHIGKNEILPGVEDFLEYIRKDTAAALCSASRNAGFIIRRLGIEDMFDAVIDGNAAKKTKPDPEVFILGADAVSVPCMECVVFEDSAAGIEAAGRAGMKSVGIGSDSVLGQADIVVSGFPEFMDKLCIHK